MVLYTCDECKAQFKVKSNLTRHKKIHEGKTIVCGECGEKFRLPQHLRRHKVKHFLPVIPIYIGKNGEEPRLSGSDEAHQYFKMAQSSKIVDDVWRDPVTAEARAREVAGEMWHTQVVLTFGKYMGKSIQWLLSNVVGYSVWLAAQFVDEGEYDAIPSQMWQKQQLLAVIQQYPRLVTEMRKKQKKKPGNPITASLVPFDEQYIGDAELLSHADDILQESDVHVVTTLTTADRLMKSSTSTSTSASSSSSSSAAFEGWQKYWDECMPSANLPWAKSDGQHGLFNKAGSRLVLKEQMEFPPPPQHKFESVMPSMLSFFATKIFFWRPVGVLGLKIRCPNKECPAPPDAFLAKSGYARVARQVLTFSGFYTMLTEQLQCFHCIKERERTGKVVQFRWNANSPSILMNLPLPFAKSFPAVICGKRAVDKEVVRFLKDRINSLSMSKLHRVLQEGHDDWYATRRGMYQTMLYAAHRAPSGILPFVKEEGSYVPPVPQPKLPCPRVLRRALLIMEMEQISGYREAILSQTGEILCIDGTRKILKKVYGEGAGTMHYLTSVLNEFGQFVTTIVTASESEEAYAPMARGLMARFRRANVPPPKILYTDTNCCRDGGPSWLGNIFQQWSEAGMVLRLDIRHWLHRWDSVVVKQTHDKYAAFMRAMAGAVLAYCDSDLAQLYTAIRRGDPRYQAMSDFQLRHYVKPHQLKSYVRRLTRGVQVTVNAVEDILEEFKGSAGLDIDGIHLFKSSQAVDMHWTIASKHIACMQDPPGISLYTVTGTATINGVVLNKYRCCRGSNSLEGLHAQLVNCVPSKRCGIMPFQASLLAFAVQWNRRMESNKVAKEARQKSSLLDSRELQSLNDQSKTLFGIPYETNFSAPMPLPTNKEEQELLGVEYILAQSAFTPKEFYINKVEEEQKLGEAEEEEEEGEAAKDDEEEEEKDEDEGIVTDVDPIDQICPKHSARVKTEESAEPSNPALEDVLSSRPHLHLPGYEEVERLAILLVKLADSGDQHAIPNDLRRQICSALAALHEHDRSARSFAKSYECKWGYTLFGRCLGQDSPSTSAAQKTKFAAWRYAQAAQISEESRLLYLMVKILKNRPAASTLSSPTKISRAILAQYRRILDRLRDDKELAGAQIPLANINTKSISTFLNAEAKRANYLATNVPRAPTKERVVSTQRIPDATVLPAVLPQPNRPQVVYRTVPLELGQKRAPKRKLDLDADVDKPGPSLPTLKPKPSVPSAMPKAPVLVVVPSQPTAASISFPSSSSAAFVASPRPPPPPPPKVLMPNPSKKPCAACGVFNCGGERKRYRPSKEKLGESVQKVFTFCNKTRKSVTAGFTDRVFDSYNHFQEVVDTTLANK